MMSIAWFYISILRNRLGKKITKILPVLSAQTENDLVL